MGTRKPWNFQQKKMSEHEKLQSNLGQPEEPVLQWEIL